MINLMICGKSLWNSNQMEILLLHVFEYRSWKRLELFKKLAIHSALLIVSNFFFQKSSLRSDISINFKIRGTWKFNRRFVCRKTLKPLFLHSVYYTLTTDIRIPTMHLNSVIISMVMSHLSLAFSLFLFLASSSFWLLLLFAMKLEFVL